MRRATFLTAALALCLSSAAWAAPDGGAAPPAAPPATPPAAASKDAEAATYIKDLPALMSKQADADAKTSIKKLVEYWNDKTVADGTKKPIPDLLEKYAKDGKGGVVTDAIDALGDLGPVAGAPPVLTILDRAIKEKEPPADVYKRCFDALKKLADPRPTTVKVLVDMLKFKIDDVVGRSADAMSGYKGAPGKLRKDMLEELIKNLEGVSAGAKDSKKSALVKKWQVIGSYAMGAINALSGQSFKDVEEARKWFNDHKTDKMWS